MNEILFMDISNHNMTCVVIYNNNVNTFMHQFCETLCMELSVCAVLYVHFNYLRIHTIKLSSIFEDYAYDTTQIIISSHIDTTVSCMLLNVYNLAIINTFLM